jgi:hypothetical protein
MLVHPLLDSTLTSSTVSTQGSSTGDRWVPYYDNWIAGLVCAEREAKYSGHTGLEKLTVEIAKLKKIGQRFLPYGISQER